MPGDSSSEKNGIRSALGTTGTGMTSLMRYDGRAIEWPKRYAATENSMGMYGCSFHL